MNMLQRQVGDKVEVLVWTGSPINPSCYRPYKLSEEDRKAFRLPSPRYVLPSSERQIIQTAIRNNPKVSFSSLASSLNHHIISEPKELGEQNRQVAAEPARQFNTRSHQAADKTSVRPEARFYMKRGEGVRNTLIYMIFMENHVQPLLCDARVISSSGELLMSFSNINFEDVENSVFKKLLSIFKEDNLVLMRVSGRPTKCIDCSLLQRLARTDCHFIYLQNNLQILTTEVYLEEEHKVFEVLRKGSQSTGVFLVQLNRGEEVLVSNGALRLIVHNSIDSLMNKMMDKAESIFVHTKEISKAMQSADIPTELLQTIYNCLISTKCSDTSSDIKTRLKKLLSIMVEEGEKMAEKEKEGSDRSRHAHFPEKIKNCKKCRVCQRQAIEKLGIEKEPGKKVSRVQQKKLIDNASRVKKSKYRCQGCSVQFQKDIVICVTCFKEFHRDIARYMDMEAIKIPNEPEKLQPKFEHKQQEQEEVMDCGSDSPNVSNSMQVEQDEVKSLHIIKQLEKYSAKMHRFFSQYVKSAQSQKRGNMQVLKQGESQKHWEPIQYP